MGKKIKVLIVDDSALIRNVLTDIINAHPNIEVIGTASNPYHAVEKIKNEIPDAITLDIVMPRMDGITFLRKIMTQHPIPVVVISSLAAKDSEHAVKALEIGAISVIQKPSLTSNESLKESRESIIDSIISASHAKIDRKIKEYKPVERVISHKEDEPNHAIIAIGASAGGTEVISHILKNLEPPCPPILISQHMPAGFTKAFADRLNSFCKLHVEEVSINEIAKPNHVYIAPGSYHLLLKKAGQNFSFYLSDDDPVNRHKPSVDVMFDTFAKYAASKTLAILLTGMGKDGAEGLKNIRNAGGYTIAQDEDSCVVFGMPKEAIARGAAIKIMQPNDIIREIINFKR